MKYSLNIPEQMQELADSVVQLKSRHGLLTTAEQQNPAGVIKQIMQQANLTGIITPFEALVSMMINERVADSPVGKFLAQMIQHGPETNNPGDPSSLEGDILHMYKGIAVLTKNEAEHLNFFQQPKFLNDQYLAVHPRWDPDKWSPVIKGLKAQKHGKWLANNTPEVYNKNSGFMSKLRRFVRGKPKSEPSATTPTNHPRQICQTSRGII